MTQQKFPLPITGMTCANCAANIERGVKKLKGVGDASVNFAAENAAVSFDPQQLQLRDVIEKIHSSGFGVSTIMGGTLLTESMAQYSASRWSGAATT